MFDRAPSLSSKKVELDRDNLHFYINFLREVFKGLTVFDISKLTGIENLDVLMYNRSRRRYIDPARVGALFQLYKDLESMGLPDEPIILDRDNLISYVRFLQDSFPYLTARTISELAGMSRNQLSRVLNGYVKELKPSYVDALWQLYFDLTEGKATYSPSVRLLSEDVQPQKGEEILRKRYPNLSQAMIDFIIQRDLG